ncbi:GTP:AMP phosphotransferase AK3, mitochondrial isoform X1 [Procambarus clarkii]|uniref:GTP:AMP phosphotransferase AK3, mitochondrial isoform X1 n=1 Tax=Procambarus clarkii TaxID=6728 RepID=UPI001E6738C4|nr:GTP:AMP phosphotransferase AK3, mitochondrial-like isoform X1 [Procambarus clarkii]
MSKLFRMVMLGAPGSGKGTISSRIVRDFGLKHLSSGDLLRSQVLLKTELGLAAETYMKAGKLVPDDVMVNLIASELARMKTTSWLLDGFPRSRPQAEALHQQEKLDLVLSLEVPDEVIIDRIKGRWTHLPSGRIYHTEFNPPKVLGVDDVTGEPLVQREDDKPESVKQRLDQYAKTTGPLKEFYEDLGILQSFHGTESNEIWPRVHKYLQNYLTALSGPF